MRLLDAKQLGRFSLGNVTLLDQFVDLQRELSPEQFSLWVWKAKISEHVLIAAFLTNPWCHHPSFFCKKTRYVLSALCK